MFVDILEMAEHAYEPFIAGHVEAALQVRFCTQRSRDKEIGAKAMFPNDDCGGQRKTEIMLALPPDSLDHSNIRDIPYLIFHEIFVHSAESWGATSRRTPTNELCAFREGFVDAAGAQVLERGLADPGLRSHLHRPYSEVYSRAARTRHSGRMRYTGRKEGSSNAEAAQMERVTAARNRGWKLFRRLEDPTPWRHRGAFGDLPQSA